MIPGRGEGWSHKKRSRDKRTGKQLVGDTIRIGISLLQNAREASSLQPAIQARRPQAPPDGDRRLAASRPAVLERAFRGEL